jgi:hypothetical protein
LSGKERGPFGAKTGFRPQREQSNYHTELVAEKNFDKVGVEPARGRHEATPGVGTRTSSITNSGFLVCRCSHMKPIRNIWKDRGLAVEKALEGRERGDTLRQSAAGAGVHVATLCRWQVRFPGLRQAFMDAIGFAWRQKHPGPERRPRVQCHPECPACGSPIAVRRVDYTLWPFWRCSTWPKCLWTSWRPRHPRDCPACGGPRFWSYSRKSVCCGSCGRREFVTVDIGP